MTNRRPGFLGRESPATAAARAAQDGAVAAFLDLDTRQRFVSEAVGAVAALQDSGDYPATPAGQVSLETQWAQIESRCFAASARYLSASQQFPPESPGFSTSASTSEYGQVHLLLAQASGEIDAFYQANRGALDQARQAVNATPVVARSARETAANALERALADATISRYPSVLRAQGDLDAACATLDQATGVAQIRKAAKVVTQQSQALTAAVEAAAGAATTAQTTLASVRTRIDALLTRTERLTDTNSALLREFSAASTRDLTGKIGSAQQHLALGEAEWHEAQQLLADGRPEEALDKLRSSRNHLTEADADGSALVDRLATLRAVKADPEAEQKKVRFRIRDAQRLVLDRGLAGEWGTVLDSQMARLDRAAERLTGVHPDYWAYLSELQAIASFVGDVVDRVRSQVSGRHA